MKQRQTFSKEFKLEAVRLLGEGKKPAIARPDAD
jgi:transposase-like protein